MQNEFTITRALSINAGTMPRAVYTCYIRRAGIQSIANVESRHIEGVITEEMHQS